MRSKIQANKDIYTLKKLFFENNTKESINSLS